MSETTETTNKYHFVTSFSTRIWEKFAHKAIGTFIEDFKENGFPDGVESFAMVLDHQAEVEPFIQSLELPDDKNISGRFKFGSLDTIDKYVGFERQFGDDIPIKDRGIKLEKLPDGAKFRFNYLPFAKKVFAWCASYLMTPENEFMVWIDADIQLHRRFDKQFLDHIADNFDITFLDRDFPWYAAETGFFILRRCAAVDQFVQMVLHAYISGFIFDMAEWHDGFVFKTFIKFTANVPVRILNLNVVMRERDVFERSMLADYMTHYKGGTKQLLKENQGDFNGNESTLINFDPEDQ